MEKNKIWLSLAKMSGFEIQYINEAFDTNWVVPLGPNVDGFENDLAEFLGENKYVVGLNSGTAAIHLGLVQLGIGNGDEVICQSFTFAASANPVVYLGASPVFIDSEKDTWNMDPQLLEEAIIDRFEKTGKYPKAIIAVHLYGMPAKMNEITRVAGKYNIPVIEDAAEALGSEYNGKRCGTFGKFGILSFNGNKIITTSGGGALICNTAEEAGKTKFLASQARDNAVHYQHSKIGYNYRLSNICAGIGRGQMHVLNEYVNRRREIHSFYKAKLSGLDGLTIMDNPSPVYDSNFWLTCIIIESEKSGFTSEQVRLEMDKNNIETRPLWKPLHLQPVFSDSPFYGNGTSSKLFENGLCLPSSPSLSDRDFSRILDVIYGLYVSVQHNVLMHTYEELPSFGKKTA